MVSCSLPSVSHILPESRIMAGMEASMMMSLRDVEVGDALVGVDHGQGGARGVDGLDVGLDRGALGFGQLVELGVAGRRGRRSG